ncbi:MAG: hypothetical protein H7Z19_11630 [Chitinophagaceae bacterium]|nr:hypothetical protein [Rubrivivax sp.]
MLATLLDNGAPFVVLDEATPQAGLVHVPLPLFFSADQVQHALRAAGVDLLVVAAPLARQWLGQAATARSSRALMPSWKESTSTGLVQ